MEAYELIENRDGDENSYTAYSTIISLLYRMAIMDKNGVKDAFSKLKMEMLFFDIKYPDGVDDPGLFINTYFIYNSMSISDMRKVDAIIRDIWSSYKDKLDNATTVEIKDIVDEYIDFKKKLNNIPQEISDEVERLSNMSDEEFAKEMEKSDDEDRLYQIMINASEDNTACGIDTGTDNLYPVCNIQKEDPNENKPEFFESHEESNSFKE